MTTIASDETQAVAVEAAPPGRPSRSRRLVLAAILVVVVIGAAAVFLVGRHSQALPAPRPGSTIPPASGKVPTRGAGAVSPGNVATGLVPVSGYFTGPNPFVPKIPQSSGSSAGTTTTGG